MCRNLDLTRSDLVADDLGAHAIDAAADREASAQNLLHGALEVRGVRLETHLAGDIKDSVKRQITVVLD